MSGKRILILTLLIGGGIAAWLVLSSTPGPKGTVAVSRASAVSLVGYDEQGETTWIVRAEEGQMEKGKDSQLSHVTLLFTSDDTWTLRGKCDSLSYSDDKATLSGNVVLSEEGGLHLVTNKADWDTASKEIRAGNVTIDVQSASLTAHTFSYRTDKQEAAMGGGVHASLSGKSPLTVTGDRAMAKADSIAIDGNVRVRAGDDTYDASHLEYSSKDGITRLSGGVVGTFVHGTISAGRIRIARDETSATENVHIALDDGFFGGRE